MHCLPLRDIPIKEKQQNDQINLHAVTNLKNYKMLSTILQIIKHNKPIQTQKKHQNIASVHFIFPQTSSLPLFLSINHSVEESKLRISRHF